MHFPHFGRIKGTNLKLDLFIAFYPNLVQLALIWHFVYNPLKMMKLQPITANIAKLDPI